MSRLQRADGIRLREVPYMRKGGHIQEWAAAFLRQHIGEAIAAVLAPVTSTRDYFGRPNSS
jgi:hypothetical protein